MKARGKVLRTPGPGPGLLMIDGRQFRFARDEVWRSAVPPKAGLDVEVDLDLDQQIAGIIVVPDSAMLPEHAAAASGLRDERSPRAITGGIAKLAVPALLAAVLLLVAWLLL